MENPTVKKSFTAIIETIHDCNLNCRYCYVNERAEKGKMSYSTLENSIRELAKLSTPELNLSFLWHGGEPLLMGLDFYRQALEIQRRSEIRGGLENSIQTNGTLINEETAKFFSENNFSVGLSLDGPKELNDRTRLYKTGESTFYDVMHAIETLRKYSVEPRVIVTLNKQNIGEVDSIYQFLKQNKIGAAFNPLVKSGNAVKNYQDLEISPTEFNKAKSNLFDTWFNDDNPVSLGCIEDFFKNLLSGNCFHYCTFSPSCQEEFLSIGPLGDVYPCGEFSGINGFRYGNINEDSIEEIFASPLRKKLTQRAEHIEECKGCNYQKSCGGGCMSNAYSYTGDVFSRDPYCQTYKTLFQKASEKIIQISERRFN
ncbi:MAG: radical SAM protein [Candidatus Pacearchaeota archaeon]|jgi:uncharacterized protein